MRELTPTLLAAQRFPSRVPYVQVVVSSKTDGIARLRWQRLYDGIEPASYSAAAFSGGGALLRVRVGNSADNFRLYFQRVAAPGPSADFSNWEVLDIWECRGVAIAARNAEALIFWLDTNLVLWYIASADDGLNWSSPIKLDNVTALPVDGLAAAFQPNGDLAVFFTSAASLYIKKRLGGNWQVKSWWDKTTGDINSIAVVADGDWRLLVAGVDVDGNPRVWTLTCGHGGEIPAGEWSDLREFTGAPAAGNYTYQGVSLCQTDIYRLCFVEKFTGTNPQVRLNTAHTISGTNFEAGLWREPAPFAYDGAFGAAMLSIGDVIWLIASDVVWQASAAVTTLDITADILSLECENQPANGTLGVELDNSSGKYKNPGAGNLAALEIGNELALNPGYRTPMGNETSPGPIFLLEAYEHAVSGGKATLKLWAADGWQALREWRARHQFRWNAADTEIPVQEILAFVLARVGLRLEIVSASEVMTGYCPDFTVHRGDRGINIVSRLLSFVPDVLALEGPVAYVLSPQPDDSVSYLYGAGHLLLEGKHRNCPWEINRVQVTGCVPGSGAEIIAESYDWEQIEMAQEKMRQVNDTNLDTEAAAAARGTAILRKASVFTVRGEIVVPANCGQQLYDVIAVTDAAAGMDAVPRRIIGMQLNYRPRKREYTQKLSLGGV